MIMAASKVGLTVENSASFKHDGDVTWCKQVDGFPHPRSYSPEYKAWRNAMKPKMEQDRIPGWKQSTAGQWAASQAHALTLRPDSQRSGLWQATSAKKRLLQMDRHCVRTQEIPLEHPVPPAHPQRAPVQWLHPSPLGAIQPTSCPPSAPGWAISHANLPKNTKVSDQWGFALGISPCPRSPLLTTDYFITRQRLFGRKRSLT